MTDLLALSLALSILAVGYAVAAWVLALARVALARQHKQQAEADLLDARRRAVEARTERGFE